MRLPRLFRTTPFRLTLLFLGLFAAAASLFLAYIYIATAGEVALRTDERVSREMASLEAVHRDGGVSALNQAVIDPKLRIVTEGYGILQPRIGVAVGRFVRPTKE